MKKLFYLFMLCAITLISCEKDDEVIGGEGHSCEEWWTEFLKGFGPTSNPTPRNAWNVVAEEGVTISFDTENPAYISRIAAYYAQPDGRLDSDEQEVLYPFGISCSVGFTPPSIDRIEAMPVIEMEGITIVRENENRYTVTVAPNSGWGYINIDLPTIEYNKKAFTTFEVIFEGQRFKAGK
jgi:hypothetical protein